MSIRRMLVTMVAASTLSFSLFAANVTGAATSGFSASIVTATNSTSSATQFITATNDKNVSGTPDCTSTPATSVVPPTSVFNCTGKVFADVPVTGSTTINAKLSYSGSASPAPLSVSVPSCAPVQLVNKRSGTNPLLPRYGMEFGAAGPPTLGSTAITVDGVLGNAAEIAGGESAPSSFSIAIWFKTLASGGGLMGFSADSGNGYDSYSADRMLYITSSGDLIFSMAANLTPKHFIQSTWPKLNDGSWHFAVATVEKSGGDSTRILYVDNNLVASAKVNSEVAYNGYWRIGRNLNWTNGYPGSTKDNFSGALSNAATWPYALKALQVDNLYKAESQSDLELRMNSSNPNNYWPLTDDGNTTFSGPFPPIGASTPCDGATIRIQTPEYCVTAACSPVTMSALATPLAVPPGTTIVGFSVARKNGYFTFESGLQILAPIVISQSGFVQKFTWNANRFII